MTSDGLERYTAKLRHYRANLVGNEGIAFYQAVYSARFRLIIPIITAHIAALVIQWTYTDNTDVN